MTNEEILIKSIELAEFKLKNSKYKECQKISETILKIDPNNEKALHLLGLSFSFQKQFKSSLNIFIKYLKLNDKNYDVHNNISLSYSAVGDLKNAIKHSIKSIKLNNKNSKFISNLGLHFCGIQNYSKAKLCFESAIKLNPKEENAWFNLGNLYALSKNMPKAIENFKKAIEINSRPEFHVDLAHALHFIDDNTAWKEYEYRLLFFKQYNYFKKIFDINKTWHGESLKNKTLIVYCEQGFGDYIQFLRYLQLIEKCNLLLYSFEDTKDLFEFNGYKTINSLDGINYDYHCSIMSLPYILNCNFIPEQPLLDANYFELNDNSKLKIGLTWAGNPMYPRDSDRSINLEEFKELTKIDAKIFGLQKNKLSVQYSNFSNPVNYSKGLENLNIIDMSDKMTNFLKTASIIKSLDLIISADTGVAHLAASLGKPTWILIPFNPDWRWGLTKNTTKWYKNVELFRQTIPKSWAEPIKEIIGKL